MVDIQFVRDNPDLVQEKSKQKQVNVDISKLLQLDNDRRELVGKIEALRAERNQLADALKSGNPTEEQLTQGRAVKEKISQHEAILEPLESTFNSLLKQVPNMPHADVPIGTNEAENVVVRVWGEKPHFDFDIKNHAELAEARGWLDKERGAKIAGSRFVYLKGDLVLLEFALWQFAFSKLTDESVLKQIIQDNNLNVSSKPFVPVLPPAVAKKTVFEATGRLNKEEQTYKIEDEDLWLNASAEHTIAPMYMGEIIDEQEFPLRYVGYTTAFRREAGTYGKDMEGIIRLHQFNKLEMESFDLPEDSLQEHFFMIAIQEYLMQQLGLPYQVLMKCTADIGGPNARGVDIEVWLPGQDKYRETHTADYITDYQARRMQTRVRRLDGSVQLVHTNDATAFSQRPLAGIIENYQNADGTVRVPSVLKIIFKREGTSMITKLEVQGVHMHVDIKLHAYVTKKIGHLDRYVSRHARESLHAEVILKEEKIKARKQNICEVILHLPHDTITTKESTMNIYAAVDIVEAKLKNQLKKYKETHGNPRMHRRLITKLRRTKHEA